MSVKKFMIRSDLEGASGVVSYAQAEPDGNEYACGRHKLKTDLLACIDGLKAGGADQIVIYDEHGDGRTIDPTWLPEQTMLIAGKPPYRADWAGGLDPSYAGVVLLGFHSKSGTTGGLLPHSYELDIRDLRLNDTSIGEIGMEAAIAGDYDLPIVLVTGDSAGCREAEALVLGVRTVVVKESLGETGAVCYPLAETAARIREAAATAAAATDHALPWRCRAPVALEISFHPGRYADTLRQMYADEINGDGDLKITAGSATAAWASYWQRKLTVQLAARRESGEGTNNDR